MQFHSLDNLFESDVFSKQFDLYINETFVQFTADVSSLLSEVNFRELIISTADNFELVYFRISCPRLQIVVIY